MNSREAVIRAVKFQSPGRLAYDFPEPFGTDFMFAAMDPHPGALLSKGIDEWGAVWNNVGESKIGQVVGFPLEDWSCFDSLKIPDIEDGKRWEKIKDIREKAGEKFLLCEGISIFEQLKFLRRLENVCLDIYDSPEKLEMLIDILVSMNLTAVSKYHMLGGDGYIIGDDWGMQKTLVVPPESWRRLWKPAYARIFDAVHKAGMLTFLHSCGYIADILDDLVDIGLDAIHMDQQENMGLELLGSRFRGKITFFATVDIQNTMCKGSPDDIREYCLKMARELLCIEGGFIPRWYTDPEGAGHRREAIDTMCREFLKISQEIYGAL